MKDTLNRQVKDLCMIADEVLKNPSQSPYDVAKRLKVSDSVKKYASIAMSGVGLVCNPLPLGPVDETIDGVVSGASIGAALGIMAGPIGVAVGAGVGACLGGLIGKNIKIKREASEKERMLKEIIKKQNAVAKKLAEKERLLKQEIENLKQMLAMLVNVADAIDKK